MKIEVENQRDNPLLNRKEIRFKVIYAGVTPKVLDVKKELVSSLKLNKDLTVVDWIRAEYGRQAAAGYAKVYADAESMGIEPESKLKKNKEEEAAKEEVKEEAPAAKEEEKKEKAPAAEEVKEEAPAAEEIKEEPAAKEKEKKEAPAAEEKKKKPAKEKAAAEEEKNE